jgi:hypothetical protein
MGNCTVSHRSILSLVVDLCEDCYRCIEANRGSHWELSNSVFGYVEKVGGYPTVEDKYQVGLHCSDVDVLSGIDWENFGFGLRPTDFMYIIKCKRGGEWGKGELHPFGNLEISPAAAVLNYGQGLFEGLKAYRTADDSILLFRPEENAMRLNAGADRMSMPSLPVDTFLHAVKQAVLANRRWIPPPGKGSLYIRPLLIGSGGVLGLAPAPEFTFVIYVSPVGCYFKVHPDAPIKTQTTKVAEKKLELHKCSYLMI